MYGPASPSVTVAWKPTPDSPKLPVPQPAPEFARLETGLLGFQKLTGPAESPPYCFQALKDHDVDPDVTGFANDPAALPTHFAPGKSLVLRLGLTPNVDQIRQKVLNDFYASKSQLGGSASQIDAQAFHGWLGQEQNTPLMGFNAVTVGVYDAGPSYGTREAKLGTSGYFFAQ